jgi:hypothetical protein
VTYTYSGLNKKSKILNVFLVSLNGRCMSPFNKINTVPGDNLLLSQTLIPIFSTIGVENQKLKNVER